ncbi:MAG: SEL1-like repeat protein [Hyphomicrobiaceae bacterium]|nr:SEL1-like repeat protein [Hyphomicrobiaceae bacterium]
MSGALRLLVVALVAALTGSTAWAAAPELKDANRHSFALVIGSRSYRHTGEIAFAHNDAAAIRQFLIDDLGYRPDNIALFKDATYGQLLRWFGSERRPQGKLFRSARAGRSNVFVYFSGHGVPDLKTRAAFLLPTDTDPDDISTAYPLALLEKNLGLIKTKIGPQRRLIVMLDACFSGSGSRGGRIRIKGGLIPNLSPRPEIIRLSAAGSGQFANEDDGAKLGLFTAKFLAGVRGAADSNDYGRRDGVVTWAELARYVREEVSYRSERDLDRRQVPEMPADVPLDWRFKVAARARLVAPSAVRPLPAKPVLLQAEQAYQAALKVAYGSGAARDDKRAFALFSQAAAAGHIGAMAWLGRTYLSGWGTKVDGTKARMWCEKAAAAENPVGMACLGDLYRQGKSLEQNFTKAHEWFQKAADKGEPWGMTGLGALYHDGTGVKQDYTKAREWYEKAAAKGYGIAMLNLGFLHRDGHGVPQDYKKARQWFENAATKGDAIAMNKLGSLYYNGQGVPQDYAKAREWYEKAAAMDNATAMSNLGILYRDAQGVKQDYTKAREWVEKAAEKGEANAMTSLGLLYANGHGVPQDYAKARAWYEKAVAKGEATAMYNLGVYYDEGRGVERDGAKAANLLLRAAKLGEEHAQSDLRTNLAKWHFGTRRALQRKLSELGHYSGAIDGNWGPASRAAFEAYLTAR